MILASKYKKQICAIANQSFSTSCHIIAYGSRVNGDAHDTSDLDLVIKSNTDNSISVDEVIEFKYNLENSNIPILIEVLIWDKLPESFKSNILNRYEILCTIDSGI